MRCDVIETKQTARLAAKSELFRLAPRHVAMEFSVESVFHPAPWGVHKAWRHLAHTQLRQLIQNCPEILLFLHNT